MSNKSTFKNLGFNGINSLISWGASVVIVGLMFKILHWKGGEFMIAAGLITEAILFFVLGFQKDSGEPEETAKTGGSFGIPGVDIDQDAINKIETGLKNFADKISAISAAADAAAITNEFAAKVQVASATFDQLNVTLKQVGDNLSKMDVAPIANSMDDAKKVQEEVVKLSKNLAALNAVYANMLSAMNQPRS